MRSGFSVFHSLMPAWSCNGVQESMACSGGTWGHRRGHNAGFRGGTSCFGQEGMPQGDLQLADLQVENAVPAVRQTQGIGFSNAIGRPKKGPEKAPGQARCGPKYASLLRGLVQRRRGVGPCQAAAAGMGRPAGYLLTSHSRPAEACFTRSGSRSTGHDADRAPPMGRSTQPHLFPGSHGGRQRRSGARCTCRSR